MSGAAHTAAKFLLTFLSAMALFSISAHAVRAESETPDAGQCFTLTKTRLDEPVWPTSAAAMDCALPHNLEIVATLTIPDSVAQRGFRSADVTAWASKSCSAAINEYAGSGDPLKEAIYSRTWPYFWQPSRGGWDAGDRSVTCGAGVVKPQLSSKGRPTSALAGGSIKDGSVGETLYYFAKVKGVLLTYSLYAARSMYEEKVRAYPGDAAAGNAARKFCMSQAKTSSYSWGYSKKADWDKGYRWIYCWYAF